MIDRASQSVDGAIEVEHEAGIVQLIEAGAEVHLRAVDVGESARGEEPAEGLREMQLLLQPRDGLRIRALRQDPAVFRACARGGCGHGA